MDQLTDRDIELVKTSVRQTLEYWEGKVNASMPDWVTEQVRAWAALLEKLENL